MGRDSVSNGRGMGMGTLDGSAPESTDFANYFCT